MMQQTDYQAALKYCNKSIMLARPGSETLALSYLDRFVDLIQRLQMRIVTQLDQEIRDDNGGL
jgi:hypothetical protein